MNDDSKTLAAKARGAVQTGNWQLVDSCARQILQLQPDNAEGHFLAGLAARATQNIADAITAFETALTLDPTRYDAAIELSGLLLSMQQHNRSYQLLQDYREHLSNSPRYLDMAATIYGNLGLPEDAWPLHRRANELQPDVSLFQANLAACSVHLGRIDEARKIYRKLLRRHPTHQRHHYQLAGLAKATDDTHIRQMMAVLSAGKLPSEKNIFLYYALGKELEDLGQWDDAFAYYKQAGDAVSRVSLYDVAADELLADRVIETCTNQWLTPANKVPTDIRNKTPIFIIGLPRTGTTLTERIISSHSAVESVGETHFMQIVIRRESAIQTRESMNPDVITAASRIDIDRIANGYLNAVAYRLGDRPLFIDKLPENVLYAGFIAKAFPKARLVHVRRSPLDACFAMYKQSYFKFAYTFDSLARYYIIYDRLMQHWRNVLGDRLTELSYESLVSNQEQETRSLLDRLELPFEQACLEFETNPAASTTASAAQIRQKIHSGSIGKWRHFEQHLQPLRKQLNAAGIQTN